VEQIEAVQTRRDHDESGQREPGRGHGRRGERRGLDRPAANEDGERHGRRSADGAEEGPPDGPECVAHDGADPILAGVVGGDAVVPECASNCR
jgi:hypothetical protein